MKTLLLLLLTTSLNVQADHDDAVETFLENHSPSSYSVFCRVDIEAPECRTLVKFENNDTGEIVDAFQIGFVAHTRPFAGTELFLPTGKCDTSDSCTYMSYLDNTHSGSFEVSKAEEVQVTRTMHTYSLELPFGTLKFSPKTSRLTLNDGREVTYERMN